MITETFFITSFLNHGVLPYWIAPWTSVSSNPTHCPLPNLYKGFQNPLRTTTLKMATAMFTKTENLQHSIAAYS
jgi:hypothetical protein